MVCFDDLITYNPEAPDDRSYARARFSGSAPTFSVKRAIDILGALAGLVLFGPIMLAVYLVLLVGGGKPVFAHSRLGLNGREFYCYKFRSMVLDADKVLAQHLASSPEAKAEWDASHKLKNDPRVTRLGHFLRRKSLDELPQFFNVLVGDMSLVGPRPIVRSEIKHYSAEIFRYCRCRPGLTGLWQTSGRSDLPYPDRVRLDERYIREQTVWMDMVIIKRTIGVMVTGHGAA